MQRRLGDDYPAFLASYERPPYKALRVNTLKLSPEEFVRIAPQDFLLGERVGESGFYTEAERLGAHPYHFMGLYYMQEPSAMAVGELAGEQCGRVLDLCAAPGGKTTHVAQKMAGGGVLIANEIDFARAKILSENVERMGIRNCAVISASPETVAEKFPAYFDLVLADAPCSGEGMFKKEPTAIPEWSEENVMMCAARQKKILDCAAETVCAGGRLIYSTCTFSEEEDEWQVEEFLARHPDFTLKEQRKLYPHEFKGEGHFMAVMERTPTPLPPSTGGGGEGASAPPRHPERSEGSPQTKSSCRPRLKPFPIRRDPAAERAFSAFCADLFGESLRGDIHTLADGRMYLVPAGMPDLAGVHLVRLGVALGEWDGKNFKPAHALAIAFGDRAKKKIPLSEEEAKKFLHGETLSRGVGNGWYVLCLDGYPLGLGKAVNGIVKNHFPKGSRLRSL